MGSSTIEDRSKGQLHPKLPKSGIAGSLSLHHDETSSAGYAALCGMRTPGTGNEDPMPSSLLGRCFFGQLRAELRPAGCQRRSRPGRSRTFGEKRQAEAGTFGPQEPKAKRSSQKLDMGEASDATVGYSMDTLKQISGACPSGIIPSARNHKCINSETANICKCTPCTPATEHATFRSKQHRYALRQMRGPPRKRASKVIKIQILCYGSESVLLWCLYKALVIKAKRFGDERSTKT